MSGDQDFEQAVFDLLWEWMDRADCLAPREDLTVAQALTESLRQIELQHREVNREQSR